MSFSRNWIGHIISQGERFVVQHLDRTFGGRIRRVFEIDQDGVIIDGDLDVSGTLTAEAGAPLPLILQSTEEIDFVSGSPTSGSFGSTWPTKPGYMFIPLLGRVVLSALGGTHVATPQVQCGTNVTFNNVVATTNFTASSLNSMIAAGVTKNAQLSVTVPALGGFNNPALDGTVPTWFVQTQATAGTTMRGFIELMGYFHPLY